MKRNLLLSLFLMIGIYASAQLIPNADFENWSGNPLKPVSWDTSYETVYGTSFETVTRVTSPQSGTYAAQVKTIRKNVLVFQPVTLPGILTLGDFILDVGNETADIEGGIVFPYRPSKLRGYYKADPKSGDRCIIAAGFSYWNSELNQRDTIGLGQMFFNTAVPNWTLFEIPIVWENNIIPDSLNIIIASSDLYAGTFVQNSSITVDNLSFVYPIIESVEVLSNIEATIGTDFGDLALPTTVEVTLDDASNFILGVEWMESSYNNAITGLQTIQGNLVLVAGITNPNNILAEIEVNLLPKEIVSVQTFNPITVDYATLFGDLPLPTEIQVTLDDSSTEMLAVTWSDANYPINGDEAGDYTLTGAIVLVDGIINPSAYAAEIDVTILEEIVPLEIVSVQTFNPITVAFGTLFGDLNLPSEIEVTLDDSSTEMLAVNWLDSGYPINGDEAGDYTLTGTILLVEGIVNPSNYAGEIDVTILEEVLPLEIVSVQAFNPITVAFGTLFGDLNLPSEIEVTLDDSSTEMLAVNWLDSGYPINGDEAGDYTLTGTILLVEGIVNPSNYAGEIDVTILEEVLPLEIVSVQAFNPITVAYGTLFGDLPLPTEIQVTLDDSSTEMLAVTWSDANYPINGDEAGDYTLTGTILLVEGIVNPSNYAGEIDVTILEEVLPLEIVSVQAFNPITVAYGTLFGDLPLPTEIQVTLDDSSTEMLAVTWSDANYPINGDEAGDYTLTGTILLVEGIVNPSNYAGEIDVTIEESTNVTQIAVGSISVFPNPNSGLFNLNIEGIEGDIMIYITDINARILYSESMSISHNSNKQLELNVEAGVYFIQIQTGAEIIQKRIVIQ